MGLLPPSTNANYEGGRSAVYFLGLAALLTLAPALIHSFLPDGGAHVIVGLDLGDRRDVIVGVFRWEGATQLAFGLAMLAVAVRYQPLTPLFLALVIVERGLMAIEGWVLTPPADGHHPPEHYASVAAVALAAIFLAVSLRRRRS
jgi:MYXO-CTERM domain-containing protein